MYMQQDLQTCFSINTAGLISIQSVVLTVRNSEWLLDFNIYHPLWLVIQKIVFKILDTHTHTHYHWLFSNRCCIHSPVQLLWVSDRGKGPAGSSPVISDGTLLQDLCEQKNNCKTVKLSVCVCIPAVRLSKVLSKEYGEGFVNCYPGQWIATALHRPCVQHLLCGVL